MDRCGERCMRCGLEPAPGLAGCYTGAADDEDTGFAKQTEGTNGATKPTPGAEQTQTKGTEQTHNPGPPNPNAQGKQARATKQTQEANTSKAGGQKKTTAKDTEKTQQNKAPQKANPSKAGGQKKTTAKDTEKTQQNKAPQKANPSKQGAKNNTPANATTPTPQQQNKGSAKAASSTPQGKAAQNNPGSGKNKRPDKEAPASSENKRKGHNAGPAQESTSKPGADQAVNRVRGASNRKQGQKPANGVPKQQDAAGNQPRAEGAEGSARNKKKRRSKAGGGQGAPAKGEGGKQTGPRDQQVGNILLHGNMNNTTNTRILAKATGVSFNATTKNDKKPEENDKKPEEVWNSAMDRLAQLTNISRLRLSGDIHGLRTEGGWSRLMGALREEELKSIQVFDVPYLSAKHLRAMLDRFSGLTKMEIRGHVDSEGKLALNLSANILEYNPIGEAIYRPFAWDGLKLEGLQYARLCRCGIHYQQLVHLCKALKDNKNIAELDLSWNPLTDGHKEGLEKPDMPHVTGKLLLAGTLTTGHDEGAKVVLDALRSHGVLERLDLSDNYIPPGCKKVPAAKSLSLARCTKHGGGNNKDGRDPVHLLEIVRSIKGTLKSLDMSEVRFATMGNKEVWKHLTGVELKFNEEGNLIDQPDDVGSIEHLKLSHCHLTIDQLTGWLLFCSRTLVSLDVSGNKEVGSKWGEFIKVLDESFDKLQSLNASDVGLLGGAAHQAPRFLVIRNLDLSKNKLGTEIGKGGWDDLNVSVRGYLNLSKNGLGGTDRGMEWVKGLAKMMKGPGEKVKTGSIKSIDLGGNDLTLSNLNLIRQKLGVHVKELILSDNKFVDQEHGNNLSAVLGEIMSRETIAAGASASEEKIKGVDTIDISKNNGISRDEIRRIADNIPVEKRVVIDYDMAERGWPDGKKGWRKIHKGDNEQHGYLKVGYLNERRK